MQLIARYPFKTITSHASRDAGKFIEPIIGRMCHPRSGRPISDTTNNRHIKTAVMASISPRRTISLMGLKL
jgi:hypothetical protein